MPEPAFDPDPNPPLLSVAPPAVGKGDAPPESPKRSLDDLTGTDQYDAINKADLDLTKKKIGAEAGMEASRKRSDDAYAARQERMLAQEGATMEDLKPWDASKELSKRETNLWEQFGSPGFIISMLASTFTAMPMNSALNAGAAAMNAVNAGKMDDYNKAFDAWKENSNLTLKRLDIEEHEFAQIDNLRSRNMESWRASASALAARFNDKRLQILLENGMDAQALEAMDAKAKSKVELSDATRHIQDNEVRRQLTMALLGDSKDPKKLAQAASTAEMLLTDPHNAEGVALQALVAQPGFLDQSNDVIQKQIQSTLAGLSQARYYGRGGDTGAANIPGALQSWTEARGGQPPTPEMKAIIEKAYGTKGASAGPAIAKVGTALEEIKERLAKGEQLDDAAQEKILRDASRQATSATTGGLLTDDDAKIMAEQYLAGDKSVFTNLGRGGQGPQNVVKVRHAIMDAARAEGMSGDDIALRMAEFAGLTSGERALGTQTARVEMFAGEAYKMMDVARKASLDVPRGEFVPANRALLAFEKNTGDPKVVAFGAAINTLVNTYAKAIAGGGQATVSDKDHAREMLESAFSEEQFEAVLNTLGQELEAARAAPGAVKQGFRDLAGNKNLQGNLGPPPNTIRYDSEGNREDIPVNAKPQEGTAPPGYPTFGKNKYRIGGDHFSPEYDDPQTPADRVAQGHGNEFSSPTRPGTINPEYERSMASLEAMTGRRTGNDARRAEEGFQRYQSMTPQEKLKWVMRLVGDSPIPGGVESRSVSKADREKLAKWQADNVDKIIDALISGEGFPNPPMSR